MPRAKRLPTAPTLQIPALSLDDLALVLAQLPTPVLAQYTAKAGGFTVEDLADLESDQLITLLQELFASWEAKDPKQWLYQAAAMLCRVSFEAFVRLHWDQVAGAQPMQWNWHLRYLSDLAQENAERVFAGLPRLHDVVVNIAPGTSKSTIFSILLPAWIWTRMPKARIISASHADDLVMDLATRTRSLMMNDRYRVLFPEIEFSEDQNAKGHYRNNFGGERKISTVAGISPMGFHAHFIIVDDPIDPKRAVSEASRLTARAFFTDVIKSRKVDKKITLTFLIMQRLGLGDPTDVLLDNAKVEGAFPVKHVCLPAELTEDVQPPELVDWYTKYNQDAGCDGGGLMDPMRLDRLILNDIRATSAFTYASQYLQKPVPPGGGMFKCLAEGTLIKTNIGDVPIENIRKGDLVRTRNGYRTVCWSGNTGSSSDFVVFILPNGKALISTPDHRIYTKEVGFVPASEISCNNKLLLSFGKPQCFSFLNGLQEIKENTSASAVVAEPYESKSITEKEEFPNIFTDIMLDLKRENTSTLTEWNTTGPPQRITSAEREQPEYCIETSGNFTTALSPKGIIFITRTEIRAITPSRTWSASPQAITQKDIAAWLYRMSEKHSGHGIDQKKEEKHIGKGQYENGESAATETESASIVSKNLDLESQEGFVPVVAAIMRVIKQGRTLVYDLTVNKDHEFFADGVLVHNCHYFNNRVKAAPMNCRRVRYYDRASTATPTGCATAGVLMARDKDGSFYVEHLVVGHWEPVERNKIMRAMALRDRAKYGKYEPVIWIEREGGSSGRDAWLMAVRALAGFHVKEHNVQQAGKKDVRAEPWSSQLAAGNVAIVQDDSWDVNALIQQHLNFRPDPTVVVRKNDLKDIVDACSGAFAVLVKGMGRPLPLRTYALGSKKKGLRRIVFTSREELPSLEIEARPSLILAFTSPQPPNAPTPQELVPHALPKNLAALTIACADLDPADYQATWNMPLAEYYDQTPEQVMLSLTHGKKIWSYLLRDHGVPWDVLIVVDDGGGDRRAPSAAQAIADMLRIERSYIFCHGERATPVLACPASEHMAIAAPNSPAKAEEAAHARKGQPNPEWPFNTHIFDTLRRARSMVVG